MSKAAGSSRGGFQDQHPNYHDWTPEHEIGWIHCRPSQRPQDYDVDGGLRLLFVAGRRVTEIAEVRSGLLTGWHSRSRAWWGEGDGEFGTLLSLGICDQAGAIRGERFAFTEMFESVHGRAQAVFIPDDALVPCAPIITEQYTRTPAQFAEIALDFARTFASGPVVPAPDDWIFAGCIMAALQRAPLMERYDLLTRMGLRQTGPADALILSLNAEAEFVLRNRRLGYTVHCHDFRMAEAGQATRAWLRSNFERVRRTPADIRRDYLTLIDTVHTQSNLNILVLNVMSTTGNETIDDYSPFDRPLGETLSSVHAKELNLMLHDLAREHDIAIVDLDAIAADLGGRSHLPDGVHASGALQAEMRDEILRILRLRGVPGFAT